MVVTTYSDTPDISQQTMSRTETPSSEFVILVSNIVQGLWRNIEMRDVREKIPKSERQSFQTYVYRVMRRAKLSNAAIFIALNYINLLSEKRALLPSLRIRTSECMATEEARIIVVSLILANKHFYDHAYRNKTWAKMTGIDKNVLCHCEKEALAALNYDLRVSPSQYAKWLAKLESIANIINEDVENLNDYLTKQYKKIKKSTKTNYDLYSYKRENNVNNYSSIHNYESVTLPRNIGSSTQ